LSIVLSLLLQLKPELLDGFISLIDLQGHAMHLMTAFTLVVRSHPEFSLDISFFLLLLKEYLQDILRDLISNFRVTACFCEYA